MPDAWIHGSLVAALAVHSAKRITTYQSLDLKAKQQRLIAPDEEEIERPNNLLRHGLVFVEILVLSSQDASFLEPLEMDMITVTQQDEHEELA